MKTFYALTLVAVCRTTLLVGCNTGPADSAKAASSSPLASSSAQRTVPLPVVPKPATPSTKVSVPCGPDFTVPGVMQRAGRARVTLKGPGVSIDVVGAPAICGPLYNTDVTTLGVHAGDGLQFEACVPQGILQISSESREPGAQPVHTGHQPSGAETIFELRGGTTYSAQGAPSDRIVFGPDLWKAEAALVLHQVDGDGTLEATVSIDCAGLGL